MTMTPLASEKKNGFTLVETLVAISILMLAIIGPMGIAAQSLQSAFIARDQIVAFYLAQEAVEIVRYHRDNNSLASSDDWLTGLTTCSTNQPCRVDSAELSVVTCATDDCRLVNYDPARMTVSRGPFTHTSGSPSLFTRGVSVVETVADREAEVVATVSWLTRFGEREITVRTRLFNQYDNLFTP